VARTFIRARVTCGCSTDTRSSGQRARRARVTQRNITLDGFVRTHVRKLPERKKRAYVTFGSELNTLNSIDLAATLACRSDCSPAIFSLGLESLVEYSFRDWNIRRLVAVRIGCVLDRDRVHVLQDRLEFVIFAGDGVWRKQQHACSIVYAVQRKASWRHIFM